MFPGLAFETFPPPQQNVAPVALMYQPPPRVPPLEFETDRTPAPLAPFVPPVAGAVAAGFAHLSPAKAVDNNTVNAKASTSFSVQQQRHQPRLLVHSQSKEVEVMPTTTRGKPPPRTRLARVQDSLIIKVTLPRSFLIKLRDEEELKKLFDRFTSARNVKQPMFLQAPQAQSAATMGFDGGRVSNGNTAMTVQGSGFQQHLPHGLPWNPFGSPIGFGLGVGGDELPSNQLNNTRPPVARPTGFAPINKTFTPSPQVFTANTLMMRPTSATRVSYSSPYNLGIFDSTPKRYSQHTTNGAAAISRQSSGSSSATASTSASVDSILSHITVAVPHDQVPLGWVSRRSSGQNVASQPQGSTTEGQTAFSRVASDASTAQTTTSATQAQALATGSWATINPKTSVEQTQPSSPLPRAKRIRYDPTLPSLHPTATTSSSSSSSYNQADVSKEAAADKMKRRQVKTRAVPDESDDDYDDEPLIVKKRQKTKKATVTTDDSDAEDDVPLIQRRSTRAKKTAPKILQQGDDSGDDSDDLPISPEKRRQKHNIRGQAPKQTATPHSAKRRIPPTPVKESFPQLDTSSVSKASSSTQPTSRTSSQEHEVMQASLRDEFRTRGNVQLANRILGSSPVKKTKVPAAMKDIRDCIERKDLLTIKPEEFWYPIALEMRTPGEWRQIDSEEGLREEIEKERKRELELEAKQKSSPVKKTPSAITTTVPESPVQPVPRLFSDLLPASVLKSRIDQAEKTFADNLLFIEGLSTKIKDRDMDEAREVERAAQLWLQQFRRGRAFFEEVCIKQGLFSVEMVESPIREFILSPEFDRDIRMKVASREGRDLEEEERVEKEMREKGKEMREKSKKTCSLGSIFDDDEVDEHVKDVGEKSTSPKRQDSAAEVQREMEPKSVEMSGTPKKSIDAEVVLGSKGLATPDSSKKYESDEEERTVEDRVALKDSESTKKAGGVPATDGVGESQIAYRQGNEKASKAVEAEHSMKKATTPELKKKQTVLEGNAPAKNTERAKTTPLHLETTSAPESTAVAEPKSGQELPKDRAPETAAPAKPILFIDLTDPVIDLTGDD